mgnify:CR=1 FL=1
MPKQPISVKRFDKGFVDKISQRDLISGTLAEALNVDVSVQGAVTNSDSFSDASATLTSGSGGTAISNANLSLLEGYGIFAFKSDVAPKSSKSSGEHLIYTSGTGKVFINDSASSSGSATLIEFDSAADIGSNVKAVYYYADGGLRISSTNFEANTDTRKQAFIRQSRSDSNTMYNTTLGDNMHLFTSGLAAPAVGTFTQFTPGTPDSVSNGSTVANDIGLGIAAVGTEGLWQPGNYAIGLTYVYHNNQESKITNWSSNLDITEGQYPLVQISIDDNVLDTATQEKFIQGLRIYLRNLTVGDEEYVLLADIDFEQGSRISLTDEFDAFDAKTNYAITNDTRNDATGTMAYEVKQANIETYSTINGFAPNEHAIHFYDAAYGYKTAVVANQRAFVGNVKYVDAVGKTKVMGDRIQYSPTLKYDTFPQTYFIDIGANDGDEIIKLLEFRDRLFVYKKNKLFIINISSNTDAGWYLEGEFLNRGVTSPNAVVKTDLGIMWANEHGLFAFSRGIKKLSEPIKEKTWRTNLNNDNIMVGFIPKRNQVLVVKDCGNVADAGYIYDLQTKSFVNVDEDNVLSMGGVADNRPISNFILLNNELCTFVDDTANSDNNNKLKFFDVDTLSAQTIDIKTPDITSGIESVDKKYYSVYLTYQNNNTNLYLRARYNDETSFTNKFDSSGTSDASTNRLNQSSLTTQEFVIATPVFKKSIQLQIAGVTATDFEIQDITIITRPKGVR